MSAPAPPRGDLSELLSLVDVSRARALSVEQPILADVATLYGERQLQSSGDDTVVDQALLTAVVAQIRKAYRAGWAEGMRFASQQFDALGVPVSDLALPTGTSDESLVRDFLSGQVSTVKVGGDRAGVFAELRRRAALAVVSAVQMGRSDATAAAFESATLLAGTEQMWVARFDLNTDPCALCARLHGTHVPIGEKFDVPGHEPAPYDGDLHNPPRHPNCRCSLVLYHPDMTEDALSGPTPLSMQAYAQWVLAASPSDLDEYLAATIVRVGSYTRMVRGKLQHVDGYFYHVESGQVVSPAQARALGGGGIRTVSVQQAKALRTQGKPTVGKAAGAASARRMGSRAPGPGQGALDVGAPSKPHVTSAQAPRAAPAPDAQGTAKRRIAREPNKQWPQGEYEIKMPSGQNTTIKIGPNGTSTATSGNRTEKANAKQTKMFLDFWDGQGAVKQTKGDPAPEEKKESEALGREVDDPKPDPVRDADLETDWQGDRPAKKAKPPEPDDEKAAKQEGVVQQERAKPEEKKPETKAPEKKAEPAKKVEPEKKPEAKEPDKKADAPKESDGPHDDIKGMSSQELASEISDVEDELRDMRRSGMSIDDDDYREVKDRLSALNAEEDDRTRPDAAESSARPAAAQPEAKRAEQPAAAKEPEKAATKAPEAASKPEKAVEEPAAEKPKTPEPEQAPKPKAEKPAAPKAAKKPAAPKAKAPEVSAEDAARAPAAVPKSLKEDATAGRAMLRRAKAADKIHPVAGDDGAAIASAMQLVNSTRHKHHVKVTDDSVRVSLKHIPVSNDGSRQYLVHSNGLVFERGIGDDNEETLTPLPIGGIDRLVGPKFDGQGRMSMDDALKNVRRLSDNQLSEFMDDAIGLERMDDFDRFAAESDRREDSRNRTQAQHEARAAQIEQLLDSGLSEGEAVEKVTGQSLDTQKRKRQIAYLKEEGFPGVNLEERSKNAYKTYMADLSYAGEEAASGYLLNPAGKQRGIDPLSMFYGNDENREKYMSDEIRDYFETNGYPLSFDQWKTDVLERAANVSGLEKRPDRSTDEPDSPDVETPKVDAPKPTPAKVAEPARTTPSVNERTPADPAPAPSTQAPDPVEPAGYKPTGEWRKGFDGFSDEEIDAEKAAADKAVADAAAGGMRSSSPKMFDLKQAAKQFGEEQQRRSAAKAVPEPKAQAAAPSPSGSEDRVQQMREDVQRTAAKAPSAVGQDDSGRLDYQNKPNAVDVKPGSRAQQDEAGMMFGDEALYGDQENDDALGAYMSPDGKTLQVHDKARALDTIDTAIEGAESNIGPDSHLAADVQKREKEKISALKQLRARVDKSQEPGAEKPAAKSPEVRADLKTARAATGQGAATLFMFDSDDDLRAMQKRNDAALADSSLKPGSAERKNREVLATKLKATLAGRDQDAKDREDRAAVSPAPERKPDLPIDDVRLRLQKTVAQMSGPDASDADREDLAIAKEWASTYYGDPDGPPTMRGAKWSEENRDSYNRSLLAGIAEVRQQRKLNEEYQAEVAARRAKANTPPPSVVLESPAPLAPEHADLADMDDRALSSEWDAVQQDMRDMRADGVKTTDEDYLENKARTAAMFSEMARRAQEGNREYIGGTPSRLEKLQELAKSIQGEPDAAKRSAMEARLVRLFRGETE